MSFSLLSKSIASSASRLTAANLHRRSLLDRVNGIRKSHFDGKQRDLIDEKNKIAGNKNFLVQSRYHINKMLDDHKTLNVKTTNLDNKINQAIKDLNLKDIKKFKPDDISAEIIWHFGCTCLIFVSTVTTVGHVYIFCSKKFLDNL